MDNASASVIMVCDSWEIYLRLMLTVMLDWIKGTKRLPSTALKVSYDHGSMMPGTKLFVENSPGTILRSMKVIIPRSNILSMKP
jgi:hypothetical protein